MMLFFIKFYWLTKKLTNTTNKSALRVKKGLEYIVWYFVVVVGLVFNVVDF